MHELPESRAVLISVANAHEDWEILTRRKLAVEPAPDLLHLLRGEAAPGDDRGGVLSRPAAVGAGVEQHEVGQPVGIAERVLERHVPTKRMAEHRPSLETQPLA